MAADVLRLTLVAGVAVMLVAGRRDAAILMALTGTTAVASRASRAPEAAQLAFVGLLTAVSWLIALGGVAGLTLDSAVAHSILPAAVAPVVLGAALASGVVRWPVSRGRRGHVALVVMTAGLTIGLGAVWELVEYASDALLGTNMSPGYADTIHDLVADVAGAVTGAVLAVRFWPRRSRDLHRSKAAG